MNQYILTSGSSWERLSIQHSSDHNKVVTEAGYNKHIKVFICVTVS